MDHEPSKKFDRSRTAMSGSGVTTSAPKSPRTSAKSGASASTRVTSKAVARSGNAGESPYAYGGEVTEDQIRFRAYEIYTARAGRPGDAFSDWIQAEHELCGR